MDTVLIVKILSILIYPVGLLCSLVLLRWAVRRYTTLASVVTLLMLCILVLSSNPKFAAWLAFTLEQQYPQRVISDIAVHDAIIVLGGGVRIPLSPAQHTQIGSAADRVWYAARLYREQKAPKIILAGGNVFDQPGLQGESYYTKELLEEWGIPSDDILFEDGSRTTQQNQRNIEQLLLKEKVKSALLVTSALHMPRAYSIFKQLPIAITPASADVLIRNSASPEVFSWLPSVHALSLTTASLHEYYGMWFSRLKMFVKA